MQTLDWSALRYRHTGAVRAKLAELYAPAPPTSPDGAPDSKQSRQLLTPRQPDPLCGMGKVCETVPLLHLLEQLERAPGCLILLERRLHEREVAASCIEDLL